MIEKEKTLPSQKGKFSLPENTTYLNCAYMSPMLKSVEEAGIEGLLTKRNPATITPTDFFSEAQLLREEYAKLIGCHDPNRIVIIPSVSYALANVAQNLPLRKGDKIIVVEGQFPSNYYPWERLAKEKQAQIVSIPAPDPVNGSGKAWNERLLEAIDKRTRMVALGHVHWADGTLFDLVSVRQRTRDVGSLMVVDGTQSVGALPFDIEQYEPDALVCGGYKWLLGPYSIGLAYYGSYFDGGIPIEESWMNRKESEDFAALVNYKDDYQPGSLRYEVGEHSNFILVPMMRAAIQQLLEWNPANIQKYCDTLIKDQLKPLKEAGFFVEDSQFRASHLFGIRLPKGWDMVKAKERLLSEKIYVSIRGDSVRVAPHLYNETKDIEKLLKVLTDG